MIGRVMANVEPIKIGDNRQPNGQFGAGNIANPNGRPKGTISIVAAIKRKLGEAPEGQKLTYAELLVERMFKLAIDKGNDQQIKNILHYVEGTPRPAPMPYDELGGFHLIISEIGSDGIQKTVIEQNDA
jgi:hypothetical protein